jgi:choline kinase
MLSEETAVGDYPFDCIGTMKSVAAAIEGRLSSEHEAVILAAGPSKGFGALTANKHKCMLDVGGATIIGHQIENLKRAGIPSRSICVVTGYHHRQIEHYLRSEGYGGSFAFNPWYQTTNIAAGLWLTKKSDSNLVVLSSDIIFDPAILNDLLAAEGDVVLAVERRTSFDAEDEKVVLKDDRVVRASKDLALSEAHGEFIGLAKLSRRGARQLWDEIDELVRAGKLTAYLTEAFERLAAKGVPIRAVFTDGRAWSDNDNLKDLQVSRESVYPRIREAAAVQTSESRDQIGKQ